jgi:hypothetical protein
MDRINWMEFREVVPRAQERCCCLRARLSRTESQHGADNTAPLAIARRIAPRVNAMVAPVCLTE